jgi:hypothetical protein
VRQYAEDFGFDLDEEGHPLEEDGEEPRREERKSESDSGEGEGEGEEEQRDESEVGAAA